MGENDLRNPLIVYMNVNVGAEKPQDVVFLAKGMRDAFIVVICMNHLVILLTPQFISNVATFFHSFILSSAFTIPQNLLDGFCFSIWNFSLMYVDPLLTCNRAELLMPYLYYSSHFPRIGEIAC